MTDLPYEHRMRAGPRGYILLVLRAAEFAASKHQGQRRKGRTKRPYIGHCIEVSRMIAEIAKSDDPTILSAAILHDTLEDTETTREELSEAFGERVADFVWQVTDDKSLPKAERKKLQIDHAPHLSPAAKLIKIADKISNVREIGNDPPKGWSKSVGRNTTSGPRTLSMRSAALIPIWKNCSMRQSPTPSRSWRQTLTRQNEKEPNQRPRAKPAVASMR